MPEVKTYERQQKRLERAQQDGGGSGEGICPAVAKRVATRNKH